jgi:hypothetical protein
MRAEQERYRGDQERHRWEQERLRADALSGELARLAAEHQAVLASTSWRVTRPLRQVMITLRRGRG